MMEQRMRPTDIKDKPRSKTPDPNWDSSRQRVYSEGPRYPKDDSHRSHPAASESERNFRSYSSGPSVRDEALYGRLGEGGHQRSSYGENTRYDQHKYAPQPNDYRSLPPNSEPPYRQPDADRRRTLERSGQSVYDSIDAVRGRPPPPQYKPPEQKNVVYESTHGRPNNLPQTKESPIDQNVRDRNDMYAPKPGKMDLHKSRSAEEVRSLGSNRSFDGQSRPMEPNMRRPDLEQPYGTRPIPPSQQITTSSSWSSDNGKSGIYEQGRRSMDSNDPVRLQNQGENDPQGLKVKPRIVPSEEELGKLNKEELIRRLRKLEMDCASSTSDNGAKMKEVNRRMQSNLAEIRELREVKEKLEPENKELRDLCYFLDDGRQKERKLAREWQRFGRYTANVMRNEVAVYQKKLQELAERQEELLVENLELKDVCMMLDEEKTGSRSSICSQCNGAINSALRDQGDGSYDESSPIEGPKLNPLSIGIDNDITNIDQTAIYIRELELRIEVLEEEKRQRAKQLKRNGQGDGQDPDKVHAMNSSKMTSYYQTGGKADAVAQAFKVLEVHEQIDDRKLPVETESMTDKERAIVREMCNVVWRKLEDNQGVGGSEAHHKPSSYPPIGRTTWQVEQPK